MRILKKLEKKIEKANIEAWDDPAQSWFSYVAIRELLHIQYYGQGFDGSPNESIDEIDIEEYSYVAFLNALVQIANKISYLSFTGPDDGANGFNEWDFSRLINAGKKFTNLGTLKVKLTDPGHHNLSCLSDLENDYAENGMIARLVSLMPSLEQLELPSAPDNTFFDQKLDQLSDLRIESGYGAQNFIQNYAKSSGFPNLVKLDFSDVFFLSDLEECRAAATDYDDFDDLFCSRAFDSVDHFTLRNSKLDDVQLQELQKIRPELQFLVVSTVRSDYVSHM